jgi:hypothetical protein
MGFENKRSKALVAVGVDAILWTVWNVRNGACCRNIIHVESVSIMAKISHYIHFWAGLQRKELRDKHIVMAKTLLSVLNEVSHRSKG